MHAEIWLSQRLVRYFAGHNSIIRLFNCGWDNSIHIKYLATFYKPENLSYTIETVCAQLLNLLTKKDYHFCQSVKFMPVITDASAHIAMSLKKYTCCF